MNENRWFFFFFNAMQMGFFFDKNANGIMSHIHMYWCVGGSYRLL